MISEFSRTILILDDCMTSSEEKRVLSHNAMDEEYLSLHHKLKLYDVHSGSDCV